MSVPLPGWGVAAQLLGIGRQVRERSPVFVPMVAWQGVSGEGLIALVPSPGPGQDPAVAVSELLRDMEAEHGSRSWFAVLIDTYGRVFDGDARVGEADDLGARFRAGDPDVVEQIMLVVSGEPGPVVWRHVYRWTPVDGWEWDEPEVLVRSVLPGSGLLALFDD